MSEHEVQVYLFVWTIVLHLFFFICVQSAAGSGLYSEQGELSYTSSQLLLFSSTYRQDYKCWVLSLIPKSNLLIGCWLAVTLNAYFAASPIFISLIIILLHCEAPEPLRMETERNPLESA